jgi:hypothetical protein
MGKHGPKVGQYKRPEQERFWEKVNKNGPIPADRPELGPCWLWTGCITQDTAAHKGGYGRFWLYRPAQPFKQIPAHRYAYEQLVGPIPPTLEPDHLCRNRACVNPGHIEPVTRRENVLRGSNPGAINAKKQYCNNGHLLAGDNVRMEGKNSRRCRACARASVLRWNERQRNAV